MVMMVFENVPFVVYKNSMFNCIVVNVLRAKLLYTNRFGMNITT